MAIRTQIRLDQVSGSLNDGGSEVGSQIPFAADSLQGSLDKLAVAVRDIHGAGSFTGAPNGKMYQDFLPSADGSFDLGSNLAEWQDLWIDGTANIDSLVADTADINGGSIDGAIIGGASTAAASVTTLDTSGVVNLNDTTESTSATSGALIVDGGVGIAKDLYVGIDLDVEGTANLDIVDIDGAVDMASTLQVDGVGTFTAQSVHTGGIQSGGDILSDTDSTDSLGSTGVRWLKLWADDVETTSDVVVGGEINVTGTSTQAVINASGVVAITDATAASSSTTGALKVTGGVSTQADLWVGDDLNVVGDTATVGLTATGTSAQVAINASGVVAITDATAASSSTTGALKVTGGISTQADLWVGDDLNVLGDVIITGGLDVNGTTTTIDSTIVSIGDTLMELASGNEANVKDLGWYAKYNDGTSKKAGMYYDTSETEFRLAKELGTETNGVFAAPGAYGTLRVLDAHAEGTLDVTGDATFTSAIDSNDATDASDATGATGAIQTLGGVSIAKKLYVGTDLDVDGTTNLDAVDIDGNVQADGTITVGVNDTGYDVKFFGDTAAAYMLWDTSIDDLVLAGAAGLNVASNAVFQSDVQIDGNIDVSDSSCSVALKDATAGALVIGEGGTAYMTFSTTDGSEGIRSSKNHQFLGVIDADSTSDFQGEMNLQAGITVAGVINADGSLAADVSTWDVDASGLISLNSSAGQVRFRDQYAASWSNAAGIPIADATSDWVNYESAYGEVSLLNAIVAAGGGAGTLQKRTLEVTGSGFVSGLVAPLALDLDGLDFDGVNERVDLYVNGQLLLSSSEVAGNGDYSLTEPVNAGAVGASFTFALLEDDVIQAVVR